MMLKSSNVTEHESIAERDKDSGGASARCYSSLANRYQEEVDMFPERTTGNCYNSAADMDSSGAAEAGHSRVPDQDNIDEAEAGHSGSTYRCNNNEERCYESMAEENPDLTIVGNSTISVNRDIVTLQNISDSVKGMVLDNFMYGYNEGQLSDDTSFIKIGVLDSTGIMEMIELVERKFNIHVKDSEILPENFDSINCISSYVYKKLIKREAV